MTGLLSVADRPVSIKTILKSTGIHRQTVHFYLRKGVLPPPVRRSRTSALYRPSAVDLVKLVRILQEQHRFSLDEIAALFRQHDYDPRRIAAATAAETTALSGRGLLTSGAGASQALDDVILGLAPAPPHDWVSDLFSAGIVRVANRNGRQYLSADSAEALRSAWEAAQLGAPLVQLRKLAETADDCAGREFDQFAAGLRVLPLRRDAGPQAARLFAALERFAGRRRRDALRSRLLDRVRESNYQFFRPNLTYIFPSKTFLEKMGLFREVDRLQRRVDRQPDDLSALRALARAATFASDWARLHHYAQEIMRLVPRDPSAIAGLGQALTYMGRAGESIRILEDFVAHGAGALAKVRLGEALFAEAFLTADAAVLLDAVVRQAWLGAEALRESAGSPALHRKVRLILALDSLGFSDPLGLTRPAEEDLLALYNEFRSIRENKLGLLSRVSLAMSRMFVTYGLYLVRLHAGRKDAAPLLREISAMDPDCVAASRRDSAPRQPHAARNRSVSARKTSSRS